MHSLIDIGKIQLIGRVCKLTEYSNFTDVPEDFTLRKVFFLIQIFSLTIFGQIRLCLKLVGGIPITHMHKIISWIYDQFLLFVESISVTLTVLKLNLCVILHKNKNINKYPLNLRLNLDFGHKDILFQIISFVVVVLHVMRIFLHHYEQIMCEILCNNKRQMNVAPNAG